LIDFKKMARINNNSSLIDELFNTVEVLGVKATSEMLVKSRNQKLTLQDERIDFIFNTVGAIYKIAPEDIIHSTDKSTKRIHAFKFIVYYLREAFYLSFPEISIIMYKSTSYVFKKHKEMKELKKNKKDILQNKFEKLDLLITEYQLKNKK
jgi:hypothetical protein